MNCPLLCRECVTHKWLSKRRYTRDIYNCHGVRLAEVGRATLLADYIDPGRARYTYSSPAHSSRFLSGLSCIRLCRRFRHSRRLITVTTVHTKRLDALKSRQPLGMGGRVRSSPAAHRPTPITRPMIQRINRIQRDISSRLRHLPKEGIGDPHEPRSVWPLLAVNTKPHTHTPKSGAKEKKNQKSKIGCIAQIDFKPR